MTLPMRDYDARWDQPLPGMPDPAPTCPHEWHGGDGGPCPTCGWDSHPIAHAETPRLKEAGLAGGDE